MNTERKLVNIEIFIDVLILQFIFASAYKEMAGRWSANPRVNCTKMTGRFGLVAAGQANLADKLDVFYINY